MAGNDDRTERRIASCQCGAVTLELAGKPIVAATCYCHSCQAAGKEFAALPGAPAVVGADGGTPFVLMRKDRLTWLSGSDRLGEHRLTPDSPTRRIGRSEEHTSELQSLMRSSYAVFCLKKKNKITTSTNTASR